MRIPPIFTVYFTTDIFFLKKPNTLVVKIPTSKNGTTNPKVYTPIRAIPFALVPAVAAIRRTLVRVGPTQGVHAKLNVNPITNAVHGDIANLSKRNGSRFS